mmetsp:Transcript_25085/g.75304  ORF Transcript_25085/g.75304 Transcript_25085/m.75304 type:complete len:455 (-) Transcript_25085:6-1370(-)
MRPSTENSFTVLTYNILARSLGSNTIPWVMSVSAATRARVERQTGQPWGEWRKAYIDDEYKRHWHKNFKSGDYTAMRRLWGRPVRSAADVPDALKGLAFDSEDRVSYERGGAPAIATTLRGVLRGALGEAEGARLFDEVAAADAEVYDWEARGPRLFAKAAKSGADVVALEEYDAHAAEAVYDGTRGTFAAAMDAAGYDGVFFRDPLEGRTPPAGLGVFWRREAFEACGGAFPTDVGCGEGGGGVSNHDLLERWHPLVVPGVEDAQDLPAKDRRNAAVARLRHRASGRALALVAVHLMTTARDGPGITRFPGEVRSGELARLKALVEEAVEPGDAVVLCGDFNTPPDEAGVWTGDLGPGCGFDTGFDVEARAFRWGGRVLKDAFEDAHEWAGASEAVCTSKNGDRTLWIDYLFHDATLVPGERSDVSAPAAAIPDVTHPSDHLPLACSFKFAEL